MQTILKYAEAIISVLLIVAILLQSKAVGFTASMMSSSSSFTPARRGPEKVLFNATVVLAVLFVITAIAFIFVQ